MTNIRRVLLVCNVILLTTITAAMLKVYLLQQCSVLNLRTLANSCVWKYTSVEKHGSANDLGIRMSGVCVITLALFASIRLTWHRAMTMASITSLHLMYRPCAVEQPLPVHAVFC